MPVLFFAVRNGDVEMVRLLLLKGADPGVTLPDSVCVLGFLVVLYTNCCAPPVGLGCCIINPPYLRAKYHKRRLNHGSFVLLYFVLFAFFSCI